MTRRKRSGATVGDPPDRGLMLGGCSVMRWDVLVYKGRRINPQYFDRPVSIRRVVEDDGYWFVVDFEAGGRVRVPMDNDTGAIIWSEPERH